MNDTAAIGYFNVKQRIFTRAQDLEHEYDLVLAVASWEERSSYIFGNILPLQNKNIKILLFSSSHANIMQKKNKTLDQFHSFLESEFEIIELNNSLNFTCNIEILKNVLKEAVIKGRLKVLMDASCMPKRYLLWLMGIGFSEGLFSCFDVLYSEGDYQSLETKTGHWNLTEIGMVSEGAWATAQVPYLEGGGYVAKNKGLYIGMGAEIGPSVPLIEEISPSRIKIYRIKKSAERISKNILDEQSRFLNMIIEGKEELILEHELNDVISVAEDILKSKDPHIIGLTIGSKLQAVAFGLAALARDNIEVLCRKPHAYTYSNVSPTGTVYRTTITDRFLLPG